MQEQDNMVRQLREARSSVDDKLDGNKYRKIKDEMQHHFGYMQRRR
jgi:hypothetical protein